MIGLAVMYLTVKVSSLIYLKIPYEEVAVLL